jgi:hypothetical protein
VFVAGPPILRPSGSSWDFLGAPPTAFGTWQTLLNRTSRS